MASGGTPPDYRGYQPRLGVAYQISAKTVVRSSFGFFDDIFGANQQSPTGTSGNWPYAFPQALGSVNAAAPDTFLQNPFPGPPVGSPTPLACAQCQNIEKNSTRSCLLYTMSYVASLVTIFAGNAHITRSKPPRWFMRRT